MIAIASIALVLGTGLEARRLWLRRAFYLKEAAYHASQEQIAHQMGVMHRHARYEMEQEAAREAVRRRRFERAASRPWEMVPPELPPPK
jgi:hypothetical protein